MGDLVEREGGMSLIGLLVVLAILAALGGMAVLAVSRLARDPTATSARLSGLTQTAGPAGGLLAPGSPADGPNVAACIANARSVERAAAAKQAADGAFPATVDELVDGRWLAEPPVLRGYALTMEVSGGRPTGKVVVNGVPAEQGCVAPSARVP